MRRLVIQSCVLALVALAATGCFRVEIDTVVNADGSGAVTIVQAIDPSTAEALDDQFGELGDGSGAAGEGAGSAEEMIELDRSRLPAYVTVEDYEEDPFVGFRLTVPFDDPDQATARLAETFTAMSETEAEAAELAIELSRDGEQWHFDAEIGAVASAEDTADVPPELIGLFLGDASFEVAVRLPGDVVSHDATRTDGDRLVWELDLTSTEPTTMTATSETGGASGLPAWAAFAVPVVLAGGFVFVLVSLPLLRRRAPAPAVAAAAPGPVVDAAWDPRTPAHPPLAPPGGAPSGGPPPASPGGPPPPPGS